VAAGAAALPEPQLAERQGEVVDDHEHLGHGCPRPRQDLAHRDARVVHPGHRLHEEQVEALVSPADHGSRVAIAPAAGPAGPIGEAVEDQPADVVARPGVLLAGVPEPDDDLLDDGRSFRLSDPRTRRAIAASGFAPSAFAPSTPNGPGTESAGLRAP